MVSGSTQHFENSPPKSPQIPRRSTFSGQGGLWLGHCCSLLLTHHCLLGSLLVRQLPVTAGQLPSSVAEGAVNKAAPEDCGKWRVPAPSAGFRQAHSSMGCNLPGILLWSRSVSPLLSRAASTVTLSSSLALPPLPGALHSLSQPCHPRSKSLPPFWQTSTSVCVSLFLTKVVWT